MSTPTDAFEMAMRLSATERAELAQRLLRSLEPESPEDADAASAWAHEIDARLQKIAAGDYQAYDWREAIRETRQELKDARS